MLFSYAYFICSLAIWTSFSKSLFNLDLTQRCLTHTWVSVLCWSHSCTVSRDSASKIHTHVSSWLLLSLTGWSICPSRSTCQVKSPSPLQPQIHFPFFPLRPTSWSGSTSSFSLRLSTLSHISRNLHNLFPFPTPLPSLPSDLLLKSYLTCYFLWVRCFLCTPAAPVPSHNVTYQAVL